MKGWVNCEICRGTGSVHSGRARCLVSPPVMNVVCADCGDVVSVFNAEGRWCGDCFDRGLKRDMHEMSVQNIKNEMSVQNIKNEMEGG